MRDVKHGRNRYRRGCRCNKCVKEHTAHLQRKRNEAKPHHESKPMPVMRGYDTMTLGEYKREQIGEVPRSAVRRNNWKQSVI